MTPLFAIPLKTFGEGKGRLAGHLTLSQRRELALALAARTVETAESAGLEVLVVAADQEVASWAQGRRLPHLMEANDGLNGAAHGAVAAAAALGKPWIIGHADLPLLTVDEVTDAAEAAATGMFLAPSYDGGTSAIGGPTDGFPFSYGPGSFRRHLAASRGRVLWRLGFALDLDEPIDLEVAIRHRRGAWLSNVLRP
jgi:2-phospho-L-lactate guanylyltransferase